MSHENAATAGVGRRCCCSNDRLMCIIRPVRPSSATRPGSKLLAESRSARRRRPTPDCMRMMRPSHHLAWSCCCVAAIAAKREMHCFKKFIFFQTTTPIDIRPSTSPDHGRHASACKVSPLYVAPFQRR